MAFISVFDGGCHSLKHCAVMGLQFPGVLLLIGMNTVHV